MLMLLLLLRRALTIFFDSSRNASKNSVLLFLMFCLFWVCLIMLMFNINCVMFFDCLCIVFFYLFECLTLLEV